MIACEGTYQGTANSQAYDRPVSIFDPIDATISLASEPALVIGAEEPLLLDRVRGAVFFREGLAIANSGSSEVLIVDSAGGLVARHGRRGDGPGEYRNLAGVFRHESGLLTWDAFHLRATVLDNEGGYVSSVRVPTPFRRSASLVGAFGNSVLAEFRPRGFEGRGAVGPLQVRQEASFVIVDLSDGKVVREIDLPGQELWAERRGERSTHGGLPIIFGRDAVAAVTDERAVLGTTDSFGLTAYDEAGAAVQFERDYPQIDAAAEWEAFARDTIRARIDAIQPGEIVLDDGRNFMEAIAAFRRDLLEDLPARPTLPSFSDIRGSTNGRLWIRGYPNPMQSEVVWVAFDENMEPDERLRMPVALRVLDFSRDRVLVLAEGELGEDLIKVFKVQR